MNPRNEAKIQNKTGWKKFIGQNFKSQKKRSYRNRRKMNQKASKHSRLFEEREKEKRGFWNFTFVKRERESFAEGSSERKRLDREIENELYRNA